MVIAATPVCATNYAGNGSTSFGGTIGNGILSLTDDGTNINGHLTFGGGFNDTLVIYVDTGASGGFTTTTNFADTGDGTRKAISGFNGGTQRSVMTFTNGFTPKFALGISSGFGGLWQLATGGANSLPFVTSVNYNNGTGNFSVPATSLGLTNGQAANIRIFGTYISNSGYRSGEAIGGNDFTAFSAGWNPFVQTAFATYAFATPPAPTYAVRFSVDMAAQIATAAFVPASDVVHCGGSFQTNPFAFDDFPLVRVGTTSIYTNTYPDPNPTNTVEQYKFRFISVANSTTNYDDSPNRSFTLKSGGQILPVVYFNNIAAVPSATTNVIKFSIDMGPQIYLGHFDPNAGDLVKVYGSFETPKWSGAFPPLEMLTNNPTLSGNASNIYSGSFVDGNYPGTVHQYKFVIVNTVNLTTNYESGSDRNLTTPTNTGALPLAYFNGVSTYAAIPVTFSVDMTIPRLLGMFNLANGDTVGCAGTFQTNSFAVGAAGFVLTNNPGVSSSNIFSGTYIDRNAPGSGERYKFVVNTNGGGTAYELPASTSGGDRRFLLAAAGVTNPLVFWNDLNTNQVMLVPTTVTFTVDMANASDIFGFPFDAGNDFVIVNGDFLTPAWPNVWQDANFYNPAFGVNDYGPGNPNGPSLILNSTDNRYYTGTFTVPAGHSRQVNYKYGIYHDTTQFLTNCDNEATFAQDHSRYIRNPGTYSLPTDIFGVQRTNSAAANEVFYGIATGKPAAGRLPLSWLGFAGVHLQTTTNLTSPVWQDLSGTDGVGTTNWPTTNSVSRFFRLWPTPQ
jgi:hypothetical protein